VIGRSLAACFFRDAVALRLARRQCESMDARKGSCGLSLLHHPAAERLAACGPALFQRRFFNAATLQGLRDIGSIRCAAP
jgi:hypothetical protein